VDLPLRGGELRFELGRELASRLDALLKRGVELEIGANLDVELRILAAHDDFRARDSASARARASSCVTASLTAPATMRLTLTRATSMPLASARVPRKPAKDRRDGAPAVFGNADDMMPMSRRSTRLNATTIATTSADF